MLPFVAVNGPAPRRRRLRQKRGDAWLQLFVLRGSRNSFWAVQLVHSGSFDSYKETSLRRANLYTAAQISHSLKSCCPEEVMGVWDETLFYPWQQNCPAMLGLRHIPVTWKKKIIIKKIYIYISKYIYITHTHTRTHSITTVFLP